MSEQHPDARDQIDQDSSPEELWHITVDEVAREMHLPYTAEALGAVRSALGHIGLRTVVDYRAAGQTPTGHEQHPQMPSLTYDDLVTAASSLGLEAAAANSLARRAYNCLERTSGSVERWPRDFANKPADYVRLLERLLDRGRINVSALGELLTSGHIRRVRSVGPVLETVYARALQQYEERQASESANDIGGQD